MTASVQPPQVAFSDFSFDPRIHAAITAAKYAAPTPIQGKAIPPILAGRDVLGLAQTGTGKTAAFALPILQRLVTNEGGKEPRVLVMVPTRELAEQVANSFRDLAGSTRIRVMTMYGGVPMFRQVKRLQEGVDIIVGCPGRILDHIDSKTVRLDRVQTLVLDEADQMFDMGFLVTIRKILRMLPAKRQNLLFSATMPNEIRDLTKQTLQNPETIQVAPISSPETVTHISYPVAQHLKADLLVTFLNTLATESVLVFTRTKHRAKRLARTLERAGVLATSLQGNLSQAQRQRAMTGFRSGEFSVMVATDIASRGIDISTVSHVVNFDLPDTVEAYLHRVGRTGRAMRTGDALTFVAREDEYMLRTIERKIGLTMRKAYLEGFNYEAKQGEVQAAEAKAEARRDDGDRPERENGLDRRGELGRNGGQNRRPRRHGQSNRRGPSNGRRHSAPRRSSEQSSSERSGEPRSEGRFGARSGEQSNQRFGERSGQRSRRRPGQRPNQRRTENRSAHRH